MGFRTKIDFSDNRQAKQREGTIQNLSGATSFGLTFSALTTGPDLTTTGITEDYSFIASTFSGNTGTTNYTWYDTRMELGESSLSALTPTNSATTQHTGKVFTASSTTIIDGNIIPLSYTGVSFDIRNVVMTDLGGGIYSGTVTTNRLDILSADTQAYTGRTIWADVSGITRTERLILTDNPQIGYVFTCIDSEGMGQWTSASTGGISLWTAGTGTDSIQTIANASSGGISSGDYSVAEGYNTEASGESSHAEGYGTIANNDYSHAEGSSTTASGFNSHAEGNKTTASGWYSHTEGRNTEASGNGSHAGGQYSIANGDTSFIHSNTSQVDANNSAILGGTNNMLTNPAFNSVILGGIELSGETANTVYVPKLNINELSIGTSINNIGIDAEGFIVSADTSAGGDSLWTAGTGTNSIQTIANAESGGISSGDYSHAEGYNTEASGNYSHAEGVQTIASGDRSHAEGSSTTASGFDSHAEGYQTTASGKASHAEGDETTASGDVSHAEGRATIAIGDYSHAEGNQTVADKTYSHAEGYYTWSHGIASHAEGYETAASGDYSHVGGLNSIANGNTSFSHSNASKVDADSSAILGGTNNLLTVTATNSVIIGGVGLTGTVANTVYIQKLNIGEVGISAAITDLSIDANGNVVDTASDISLKENIETIENSLDKVLKLRGVTFNWKDRYAGGNDIRVGFIAQEVQPIMPELVKKTSNGLLGVNYKEVTALLVEAVKELASGITTSENLYLETQTIFAEDNNIELNYSGTQETAIGGGISVLHAKGKDKSADLITDKNGDWITNNNLKPKALTIPYYTPTTSDDTNGNEGNITRDDNYMYIKTIHGWKRSNLESF